LKHILLVRFSSIGDLVQSTAVLAPLKRQYPNSRFFFMTLESYAPLLEQHPLIDEIICVSRSLNLAGLRRLGHHLHTMDFDLIFDLHNSLRSRIILSALSDLELYRVKKPRLNRWLFVQWHYNRFSDDWSYRKMFLEPLMAAGIPVSGESLPSLVVSEGEMVLNRKMLENEGVHGEYFVCVPGAAWPQKSLGVESYLQAFQPFRDLPLVILGSARDAICFQLAEALPNSVNLAGKTSLRSALSILKGARTVIGSDTGLVHAAEALGKPVVMILGPTTREMGAGSWRPESTDVEVSLWCRPCSQNGKRPCYRREQYCLTQIDPLRITNAIRGTAA